MAKVLNFSRSLTAVALFVVIACGKRENHTIIPRDGGQPGNVVRFTATETASFLPGLERCGDPVLQDPSGTWTPDAEQIYDADALARQRLADSLRLDWRGRGEEYLLQMFGVVLEARHIIFVNGFHPVVLQGRPPDAWRSFPIVTCDVGIAGFRAIYDVRARRIEWFRFDPGY